MRTTVTLDPDTEQLLRDAVAKQRRSFKQVLNEAIRRGLQPPGRPQKPGKVVITAFRSGYARGVDRRRLQQLADALETGTFLDQQDQRS